ncbi:hypothetical protein YB2330_002140 [Saitoella coloradoensis]
MLAFKSSLRPAGSSFRRVITAARKLHIHEHQANDLLRHHAIRIPAGGIARTLAEARALAEQLEKSGKTAYMVKAQVLANQRQTGTFENGVKGGVRAASSAEEVERAAEDMLGHRLTTPAPTTNPAGLPTSSVLVTEKLDGRQLYLAITCDRKTCAPIVVCSRRGGIELENLDPESIHRVQIKYSKGITDYVAASVASALGLGIDQMKNTLEKLWTIFKEKEALMLEINPLIETTEGKVVCASPKFSFDNAARSRQPELFGTASIHDGSTGLRDLSQEVAEEVKAEEADLVYIKMFEGNVGTLVNGAGLAMSTLDTIAHYGGASANFLDAGGRATSETIKQALTLILSDKRVKSVLVNIYGGLTRGDMIANGIILAAKSLDIHVPVVVRIQGTNSKEGQQIIRESGLGLISCDGMEEAAKKAIELANAQA